MRSKSAECEARSRFAAHFGRRDKVKHHQMNIYLVFISWFINLKRKLTLLFHRLTAFASARSLFTCTISLNKLTRQTIRMTSHWRSWNNVHIESLKRSKIACLPTALHIMRENNKYTQKSPPTRIILNTLLLSSYFSVLFTSHHLIEI